MDDTQKPTKAQLDALRLFPNGHLLAKGRYANLYAALCEKGFVRFEGYESGKRKFRLTEAGHKLLRGETDVQG